MKIRSIKNERIDIMKEQLFTTKSSRFKINPKLTEHIGQMCDIKHTRNESYITKRKNWKKQEKKRKN